jgi:hypothetical protein
VERLARALGLRVSELMAAAEEDEGTPADSSLLHRLGFPPERTKPTDCILALQPGWPPDGFDLTYAWGALDGRTHLFARYGHRPQQPQGEQSRVAGDLNLRCRRGDSNPGPSA